MLSLEKDSSTLHKSYAKELGASVDGQSWQNQSVRTLALPGSLRAFSLYDGSTVSVTWRKQGGGLRPGVILPLARCPLASIQLGGS